MLVATGLLLARTLPSRMTQARRLSAAERALAGPDTARVAQGAGELAVARAAGNSG